MADVISATGELVCATPAQARYLGYAPGSLDGVRADAIYEARSAQLLRSILAGEQPPPAHPIRLQCCSATGRIRDTLAVLELVSQGSHARCLRATKLPADEVFAKLDRLASDNEVLSSIVSTSRVATYCIEFIEPVDLTAPDHEILRQVFENGCVWRYCNESMAHLYRLPIGKDLNRHEVREVFARNPENEAFTLNLVRSGWQLDGVLSLDHRYDGVDFFVANDVRADVRRGQLHRFWGTVSDANAQRARERELEHQASMALDILGSLPDPVFVVDGTGRIQGANPAVEWKLGWHLDSILGTTLEGVLNLGVQGHEMSDLALPAPIATARPALARCRDGRLLGCDAIVTHIGGDDGQRRCAAILRFSQPPAAVSDQGLGAIAPQMD